jgi:hypothetical protein
MRGEGLYRELLDLYLKQTGASFGLAIYSAGSDQHQANLSAEYWFPKGLLSDHWHRSPVGGTALTFPESVRESLQQRRPSVVLLIPPIVSERDVPAHLQVRFPGMGLHEIAAAEALHTMPSEGQLLAILPAAMLTASRSPRKRLFAHWQPTVVIFDEGSQSLFPDVHGAFRFTMLAMARRTSDWHSLRMFRIPSPTSGDDQEVLADFGALLARQRGRSRYGYVVSEPLAPDAPLVFERYDPEVLQRREELARLGPLRPLEAIANLIAGVNVVHRRRPPASEETGVPVIDGRAITRAGRLDMPSVRHWIDPAADRLPLLQPGDICVRAIAHPSEGSLAAAVVEASQLPMVASERVLVVRPHSEFRHASDYLAQYLRSPRAWELLRAEGLTMHLTSLKLGRLVVPLPDAALLEAHADLRQTIEVLDAWRQEADVAAESLFYEGSPEAARERLLAARLVRQRVQAAGLLDDLGWQVRTRFPFPVARRWTKVQAAAADIDGYASVLEAAEIVLCYVAIVAIIMARASEQPIPYLAGIRQKLQSGRGLEFGDWHRVLVEAADGEALQSLPRAAPFREAVDLFADTDIRAVAERLRRDHRNRLSHLGRPTGLALVNAFDQAKADLLQLLHAAEFLADYPLRRVMTTQWDTYRSCATITYRELMGADTMVPLTDADYPASTIESESLYLVDRGGTWHLLRPLLVARPCQTCNTLAIFRPNKYDRATGGITLQSLDHEHTIPGDDLRPALRAVGLPSTAS